MKLKDSEALFLLQLLFYAKNNASFGWEAKDLQEKVEHLHKKLESYFSFGDFNDEEESSSFFLDHDLNQSSNEDCCWSDEEKVEDTCSVSFEDLTSLDSIEVSEGSGTRVLKLVDGTKKMVDVDLDNGEELLCDLVKIVRKENELHVETAEGWNVFFVKKFSNLWLKLPLDKVCILKEDK